MSGECLDDKVLDFQQSDAANNMFFDSFKSKAHGLISQVFTDTQIEKMTKTLNEIYTRDDQRLEEKYRLNLKNLWDKSNLEFELAEVKAIKAAREYLKHTDPSKWITWRDDEIEAEWLEFRKDIKKSAETVNKTYKILYDAYNEEKNMLSQIKNLYDMKSKKFFDIMKNIMEYEKLMNVDIRKNYYQFTDLEFTNNIKYYLKIVYYALFIIYIFFGDFMIKKRYQDYRFYIIAIIYLLLPFTTKYIIGFISYIYNLILEYFNLKSPVYAYSDIVQANNIDNIYTAPVSNSKYDGNKNNPNLDYYLNNFISNSTMQELSSDQYITQYSTPKPIQPDPYCEISGNSTDGHEINIYCPSGNVANYIQPFMTNINKNVSQEELSQLQTSCNVLLGSANTYSPDTFVIESNSLIDKGNFKPIICQSYIP